MSQGKIQNKIAVALLVPILAGSAGGGGSCAAGGLNEGHKVGDEHGGVDIEVGDIAVAPAFGQASVAEGGFILFSSEDDLIVGWPETGATKKLPVSKPFRLAFSKKRSYLYVSSHYAGGRVSAIDIARSEVAWHHYSSEGPGLIASTKDDNRVISASGRTLYVIDALTGTRLQAHKFPQPIVDIEILPDDKRLLVTLDHVWADDETLAVQTTIVIVNLVDGAIAREFNVPNCADRTTVAPTGKSAFMAPTTCERESEWVDPISVIDLEVGNEHFVKNLPGFGPVAVPAVGDVALGFVDAWNVDSALFDDPSLIPPAQPRYSLMILDSSTLGYELVPYGDALPRYALTPDGNKALIDSVWSFTGVDAQILDIPTKSLLPIGGQSVYFDTFAPTAAGDRAFGVAWNLFDLDIEARYARAMRAPFIPTNLNLAADQEHLFLREDTSRVCVYSIAHELCLRDFDLW